MIGRSSEISFLKNSFLKGENQIVILYGREGIGKTEIIKSFCEDKAFFYYMARQVSEKEQKAMFAKEIEQKYDLRLKDNEYSTALSKFRSSDGSKMVVVIDEFQYIAKKNSDFLKSIIDLAGKKLYPGPVLIVLISSSISFIENDLKNYMSTSFKKINLIRKVSEVNFVDLVHFFEKDDIRECVKIYGVIGGVPKYMEKWNKSRSVKDNICKLILNKNGYLYSEAENYVSRELREISIYNTILYAIASGNRKLNDLFNYTGFSRAKISVYIKNLMELDIVEKVNSFETAGRDNTQKGLYQISSTFINFWYKFIFPNLSKLNMMSESEFYDKYIEPEFNDYLDRYFTKVCTEYLILMDKVGQLPIRIEKIGSWIGKKGTIDIIAQNNKKNSIVGICKWKEKVVTYDMCEELFKTMDQAKIRADYYYLFSSKTFDDRLKKEAEAEPRIVLVDINSL